MEIKEKKNVRHRLAEVVPLKSPYVIFLEPSGVCNFRCGFCPVNNSTYNNKERKQIMSTEIFDKVIHDLLEFEEPIKVIELYAFGEPLLNKNLPSMIKRLKDTGKVEQIRVTTNGSLLSRDVNRALSDAGMDYMKISIESMSAKGYMDVAGVSISWNEFVGNIRDLYNYTHGRGGKTKIGIKIFSNVLKKGEKELFFETFNPISDYTFIETAYDMWAEYDDFRFPDGSLVKNEFTERNAKNKICSYPFTHMLLTANGDIGLCCVDWMHKTAYANIKDTSLHEAWNSKKLYDIRMKLLNNKAYELPFCRNCEQRGNDNIDSDAEIIIENLKNALNRED